MIKDKTNKPLVRRGLLLFAVALIASTVFGVCFAPWLLTRDLLLVHRLSILNPIEWFKMGAVIGGILFGGVHTQSFFGAWLGAFIVSGAVTFIFYLIIICVGKVCPFGRSREQ